MLTDTVHMIDFFFGATHNRIFVTPKDGMPYHATTILPKNRLHFENRVCLSNTSSNLDCMHHISPLFLFNSTSLTLFSIKEWKLNSKYEYAPTTVVISCSFGWKMNLIFYLFFLFLYKKIHLYLPNCNMCHTSYCDTCHLLTFLFSTTKIILFIKFLLLFLLEKTMYFTGRIYVLVYLRAEVANFILNSTN